MAEELFGVPVEPTPQTELFGVAAEDDPESEQTVIGSIARGAGAGVVDIAQGIAELGASGLTAAGVLEGKEQEATTKFFEDAKTAMGLTPERTAGKVVETIVNYGAPGIGVFSWVSKADKARRALKSGTRIPDPRTWFGKSAELFGKSGAGALTSTRVGRAGLTTAGTGIADVFVSPSTNSTLADSWDAMPEILQTEDEGTLTGKELSAVRLRNKFRLGVEGASFNAAGEILLPVIGGVVRSAALVPGVPLAARGISAGLDFLGSKVGENSFVKRFLRPDGLAPSEIATAVRTTQGVTEAQEAQAVQLLAGYDKSIKQAIRFQSLTGRGKPALQRAYNDTMDYLTGDMTVDGFKSSYGKKATKAVDGMRNQIDDLSNGFESSIRNSNLDRASQDALLTQFQNSQGTYIRRLYELHLNPSKFRNVDPTTLPQYRDALDQVQGIIQTRNPSLDSATANQQAAQVISKVFDRTAVSTSGLSQEAIDRQMASAIGKGSKETVGRSSLFRLADGMLQERSSFLEQAPVLREMMGEIRNPRNAFLLTVDNMSNTLASQRLFDSISGSGKLADGTRVARPLDFTEAVGSMNAGGRPFSIAGDNLTVDQIKQLNEELNYSKMGEFDPENAFGGTYGSLSGTYVPTEIQNSLTTPGRANSWSQEALAIALQAKGLSQMTKTVLNPISQVRNLFSNFFILGANGLLGRNMGVFEGGSVLMANALDSPEQFKLLKALQDEGTIGQNLQLREMEQLFQEHTELGVANMLKKGGTFLKDKTPFVKKTVDFMQKTYKLGDDYPKVIAALGEKARYANALRKGGVDLDDLSVVDDVSEELANGVFGPAHQRNAMRGFVKESLVKANLASRSESLAGTDFGNMLAADLVKMTMPTYSMVPEIIKAIRRIPVAGNFISYPAEIMRTTGNILNRSVKELGFKATDDLINSMGRREAESFARQIRAIGAERLTGMVSSITMAPIGIRESAHTMLGITKAEEELLDKNKPYYAAGDAMVFLDKPDEDLNAEAINLSYMLPYEYLLSPARAALETYQAKGAINASESDAILAGAWEGFKKFAEPFASESLGAERIIDVTTRQGKTKTGSLIYDPEAEGWGDMFSKSMTHIAGAFIPGIVENAIAVKGGEFKQGRITRAATGTPSKTGQEYTIAEEVGAMMTGLRPVKINIGKSLGYSGSGYVSGRSRAVQLFTRVADDNDATVKDILEAYTKANESKRRQQAELKVEIDIAKDAGFSKSQIYKALKETGIPRKELTKIINNKFDPIKISRSLLREVAMEVNVKKENRILQRLPTEEVNAIRRTLQNTEIIPTNEEQTSGELFGVAVDPQPQTVVQEPQAQPTESFIAPVTEAVSGAVNTVSDIGGNLLNRARTLAPGLLGDPKNQAIVDRANQ